MENIAKSSAAQFQATQTMQNELAVKMDGMMELLNIQQSDANQNATTLNDVAAKLDTTI